jgi:hypothetical protein
LPTGASTTIRFYDAAIGKKAVMAVTGIVLFGYVLGHMVGNLQIFAPDRDQINHYAAFLHSPANVAPLWLIRAILLAAVVLHIVAALQLTKLKSDARPRGYCSLSISRRCSGSLRLRTGGGFRGCVRILADAEVDHPRFVAQHAAPAHCDVGVAWEQRFLQGTPKTRQDLVNSKR